MGNSNRIGYSRWTLSQVFRHFINYSSTGWRVLAVKRRAATKWQSLQPRLTHSLPRGPFSVWYSACRECWRRNHRRLNPLFNFCGVQSLSLNMRLAFTSPLTALWQICTGLEDVTTLLMIAAVKFQRFEIMCCQTYVSLTHFSMITMYTASLLLFSSISPSKNSQLHQNWSEVSRSPSSTRIRSTAASPFTKSFNKWVDS